GRCFRTERGGYQPIRRVELTTALQTPDDRPCQSPPGRAVVAGVHSEELLALLRSPVAHPRRTRPGDRECRLSSGQHPSAAPRGTSMTFTRLMSSFGAPTTPNSVGRWWRPTDRLRR